MVLVDDLIAAKDQFIRLGGKGMKAAHALACQRSPTALQSLVMLRESLPSGFADFKDFEASRHWRKKDAYAAFDRAITTARKDNANVEG